MHGVRNAGHRGRSGFLQRPHPALWVPGSHVHGCGPAWRGWHAGSPEGHRESPLQAGSRIGGFMEGWPGAQPGRRENTGQGRET